MQDLKSQRFSVEPESNTVYRCKKCNVLYIFYTHTSILKVFSVFIENFDTKMQGFNFDSKKC